MSSRRSAAAPLLAALTTVLLWASAFIVIRSAGAYYSPGALAFGRLLTGSLVLSVVALIQRPSFPRGRPLALVIAYGILWFGLYTLLVNAAEQHLDAGTTALVVNVGPILIAVLAGIYLKEGFPRGLVAGLVIAFGGVATISAATSTGKHDLTGVLLALGAAVLYAVGVLLQKQALVSVDAFAATWVGCLAGMVVTAPFAGSFVHGVTQAPVHATAGVAFLGAFPTAVAFGTWAYALKRTSAGRLSSSTYLVPGIAVLMSWAFLGEVPSGWAFAGGALCLLGVAVTRWKPRATRSAPAAATVTPDAADRPPRVDDAAVDRAARIDDNAAGDHTARVNDDAAVDHTTPR